MERILITAIGSFSADITIKEIHQLGYEIVGCDIYNKDWVVDSKNVEYFEQAPLATNKEEYINFIKKLCNKYNIKYIIPLTDLEVDIMCEYKTAFMENGITICISDMEVIKLCRDKYKLPNRLKGICPNNIINTQLLENTTEDSIEFPVVVKPIDGRSSQGMQKIYNNAQFKYYKAMCNKDKNIIVQPLIEGNIVTVDVVSDLKNNKVVAVPRRELLRTGNGAGTTVETFYNKDLIDLCVKIVKELKINGAVNIEFIETDNKFYYFLEINPRFSGGVEFSNIAGYNIIKNHLNCFINKEIEENKKIKEMIIARKYEEYIMKEK